MSRESRKENRGVALILVVGVLAVVAVMGVAVLSSASLQQQVGKNATLAVSGEEMAESGVELACYYLQYPDKAPGYVSGSNAYWTGGTLTFGASVPGSVVVQVSQTSSNKYSIVSTAKMPGSGGTNLLRSVTAQVQVDRGFQVKHAGSFSGDGYIPATSTFVGDVQAGGRLTILGSVIGTVNSLLSPNLLGGLLSILWDPGTSANNMTTIPSPATVTDYSTYVYQGTTYSAKVLTGLPANTALGPTADNPAGIYRYTGNLTMNSNVTINGTLLVSGGNLTVGGSNVKVTPAAGFPAMVLSNDLIVAGALLGTRDLTANGIVWLGGNVKASGLGTKKLDVVGAMMWGNGGSIDSLLSPTMNVTFDKNKVANVQLDKTATTPGVKYLSYQ